MASSAQRDRLLAALAQMTNAELNAAISELGDGEHLTNLAQILNVKKPALRAHPDPASLVRARVRSGGPARAVVAALEIAGPCADACIDDLGDERADDPSKDDMLDVLPPLVEEFGTKVVTLMLAAYPAMDAPCGTVFDDLLDSDDRFTIGPASDDATAPVAVSGPAPGSVSDPEQDTKRQRRKEAEAKKKEQAAKKKAAQEAAAAALRAARKHKHA